MTHQRLDEIDFDVVVRRSQHTDRYTIIAFGHRPGVQRFFMVLEHEHFPPMTPLNDEFQYVLYLWRDLPWAVVILPAVAQKTAERVAAETGMRLAKGVPTIGEVGHSAIMATTRTNRHFVSCSPLPLDRIYRFPIDHDRAFTLENDKNSPVYLGGGDDVVREEEQRWIAAFWKRRGRDVHGDPL